MRRLLFCLTLGVLVIGWRVSSKTARAIAAERSTEQVDGPHGTVQGKLIGADGSPIGSAWVAAIPVDGEVDANNPEQLTSDDGTFSLDVPPGKYFIVANYDWPATRNAPVLTTYHPSSENESGAQGVEVKAGAKLRNIDVKVTRVLTLKTFEVLVTGDDGKPVPSADAYITQTNQAGIAGSDSGATYADKSGHVKLTGFVGLDYMLFAENGIGLKKTCSAVMKLDKDHAPTGVIAMQLTMAQPQCRQQEDAARKAAYAMQAR
jgi:hypothetical protein